MPRRFGKLRVEIEIARVRQKNGQVIVCAQFTGSKLALQASGGGLGQGDGFEQLLLLGGDGGQAGGRLALVQRDLVVLDPADDLQSAFRGERVKHRLQLEHTSGLSWHAARQDFGAKAVFDNLNALAAYVATEAHLDPESLYKINRTLAIDKIKRQLGRWLLTAQATTRRLKPLLAEIALNLQKFVPERSQPRKPQPKPHLSHAYK
jgi:hypothetical protein